MIVESVDNSVKQHDLRFIKAIRMV